MGTYEPCQVRKEAAVSKNSHVPQGSLGRANCNGSAYGYLSTEGARQLILHIKSNHSSMARDGFFMYGLPFVNMSDYDIIKRTM